MDQERPSFSSSCLIHETREKKGRDTNVNFFILKLIARAIKTSGRYLAAFAMGLMNC